MRSFLLACSFLTIIPVGGKQKAGEREMAQSLYYYPVVGFIIGALLAGLAWFSHLLHLEWGGDALIVVTWIAISGGLHLDGLMDSADGLFSGRDRSRKLEIMKDSRVGAMGTIALVAAVLLKFAMLTSLPYDYKLRALLFAPAVGRCCMVYAVVWFPRAREGPSLAKCFGNNPGTTALPAAIAAVLAGAYLAAGGPGILAVAITAVPVAGMAWGINRSLGGHTGDTYGAVCEVGETLFLIITTLMVAGLSLL